MDKTDQPSPVHRSKWHKYYKWIIYGLWTGIILSILAVTTVFYSIDEADLPTFEELENPQYDLASIIYDANGTSYGKYYIENRVKIHFDDLSPTILNALLSTEDERFFGHTGIDFKALIRVAFKTILLSKESSGGGSTISQQLAKLLFDRPNLSGMGKVKRTFKLVQIKFKEWITAVKLEKSYTKEEIIAMYLNKFEFINGAHGIQAAAQTYFDKNQDELDEAEAAVLVGMLKNPSLYNPRHFPEKSKNRRNVVLTQMYKAGHLDKESLDSLKVREVDMSAFKRRSQSEGPAPYFRSELTKWLRKLFREKNITKPDGGRYNIYTDGLKIYTTIDLKYQKYAEEAVWEHMKWNQERYFRVWNGMDPWTYDADKKQKAIRKDVLERKIKASDRYLALRDEIIGEIISEIRGSNDNIPLSDNVIKALIEIDKGRSSFRKEISENNIKEPYKEAYEQLIRSENWETLKAQWEKLLEDYDEIFNSEVKMMVFDYGEEREKEIDMTPLDSVKYHNQHLQSGFLAVQPGTGYIKAWVGGINHKYFKYDHVNSRRQVGSTIKPFVYSTAISLQGTSPCTKFDDIQYSIAPGDGNFNLNEEWSPSNADGKFTNNQYNLYQGLLYSKNSITVRLVKEMGNVDVIRTLLRNVGIKVDAPVLGGQVAVPPLPSICLGAVNLSLMEMTGAYTTFANNGMYTEPIFVTRIEDKNGKVLYTGIPDTKVALNSLYNSVMVDMLQNNVGRSRMGLKTPIGGKTGTTNDYADGWFIGITPDLVMGTWVGGDDKWIRFLTLNDGQGQIMARPVVEKFVRKLETDSLSGFNSDLSFREPPKEFKDMTDCDKNKPSDPEKEQVDIMAEKMKKDEFEEEFEEDLEGGGEPDSTMINT